MPPKRLITLRLPPDLLDCVDGYALSNGWRENQVKMHVRGGAKEGDTGRTGLIQSLLEALVEGRVTVTPRAGANAFPVDERGRGLSASFPALICCGPDGWTKEPAKGYFFESIEGVSIYNTRDPSEFSVPSESEITIPTKETKS